MTTEQVAEAVYDFSDPGLWVDVYLPLVHCTHRRELLYGSRDSLKSGHVVRRIVARMLKENCKGMLVRKVFDSIKGSQYEDIERFVNANGLAGDFIFRSSPLEIVCKKTGARAIARGMDKSGKAKSIPGIDWVWYEEADELTLDDFMQTTLTLRGKGLKEWLTFNSPFPDHWIAERFFPGTRDAQGKFHLDLSFEQPDGMHTWVRSSDPTAVILHTCYKHNPYCTQERAQQYEFMRLNLPDHYRTKGLGLFGNHDPGSLWCKQWDRMMHMQPREYDPGFPVHLTLDQNRLPYATMLGIQVVPVGDLTEIRVFREWCLTPPTNSTEEVVEAFMYDLGHLDPECFGYGDPTGGNEGQKKEKKEMASHYHAFEKHMQPFLRAMKVLGTAPSIKGRQWFMARMLKNATYLRLVVDPSCRNLIGDFEHLVEDENGGYVKRRVKDPKTGQSWEERGHCMDALINFLFQCFNSLYRIEARV